MLAFSELASLLFWHLSPLLTVLNATCTLIDLQFCVSSLDISFELQAFVSTIVDSKVDLYTPILHRRLSQTEQDPKPFLSSSFCFSKSETRTLTPQCTQFIFKPYWVYYLFNPYFVIADSFYNCWLYFAPIALIRPLSLFALPCLNPSCQCRICK